MTRANDLGFMTESGGMRNRTNTVPSSTLPGPSVERVPPREAFVCASGMLLLCTFATGLFVWFVVRSSPVDT